jgi:hypothetical protein
MLSREQVLYLRLEAEGVRLFALIDQPTVLYKMYSLALERVPELVDYLGGKQTDQITKACKRLILLARKSCFSASKNHQLVE